MALRKIPEQAIVAERRMVEEIQTVNKKLEETLYHLVVSFAKQKNEKSPVVGSLEHTAVAIEEYFKPIDKQAEIIMNTQLEQEERTMKDMVKTMKDEALMEKVVADRIANTHVVDRSQNRGQGTPSTLFIESQIE